MGKTIRFKMSGSSSVTVGPEKLSNRKKNIEKKIKSHKNRAKEKRKLGTALSVGKTDNLPTPIQKHTITPNRHKRVRDH